MFTYNHPHPAVTVEQMQKAPKTRFKRELNKWMRHIEKGKCIALTLNGKTVCVALPTELNNLLPPSS